MSNSNDELAQRLLTTADDIARLLALNFTRECETQADAALMLNDYGFETARIAELLGAKYDTVYKSLRRAGRLG